MSPPEILSLVALGLAAFPMILVVRNLRLYRGPGTETAGNQKAVSVLIPARNEADKIARTVGAVQANRGVDLEILVMDDGSEDGTGRIVRELGESDPRVRVLRAPKLPDGWCGKQHACWRLAESAEKELLLFLDADVTLKEHAVASMAAELEARDADLVSGIPRQVTGSFLERLLIPLIHFVLLGFLPMARMRRSRHPAFAAGCGQLFMARKRSYFEAGGHRVIKASRHDGIQLPRAFRRAGFATDLFDATGVATCRMYRRAGEVWNGLAKNATEGMASPSAILPWTVMLVGGQVLPPVLLVAGLAGFLPSLPTLIAGVAVLLSLTGRWLLAARFRQSSLGAWLHPLGIALLVAIQWFALTRELLGRPVAWKGRTADRTADALHTN